jgi:hypothetical protein
LISKKRVNIHKCLFPEQKSVFRFLYRFFNIEEIYVLSKKQ